jgi:hypothetical protein
MAINLAKSVPPLVLDLLRTVHIAIKHRTLPHWVSIDSLDPDQEREWTAVSLAKLNGWVSVGGRPQHRITITVPGIGILKDRGWA